MKYFSVPADFRKETIDKYDELNKNHEDSKVVETYGQVSIGNFFESGRNILKVPKVNFDELKSYVEYSKKKNIEFNYTFNASCMNNKEFTDEGVSNIKKFFSELYESGINSLTISLPPLIELVKSMKYDFKIKASTICQINNASKATYYKNMGVDRIVIDEGVHRDFEALKSIRQAFGDKVEVIVNNMCHKHCIYRMFHYNEEACDSFKVVNQASAAYYINRCFIRMYDNIGNLMKITWIRPEDLKLYTGIGINYFKIQGRQYMQKGGDPVRAVRHYMEEQFDGCLFDLIELFCKDPNGEGLNFPYIENKNLEGFVRKFYENPGFCKNDCMRCGYCENFAKKFETPAVMRRNELVKNVYKKNDAFLNMIK